MTIDRIRLATARRHARGQGHRAVVHVLARARHELEPERPLCGRRPTSGLVEVGPDDLDAGMVATCAACVDRALDPGLLTELRRIAAVEEDTGHPAGVADRYAADLIRLGLLRRREATPSGRPGPVVLTTEGRRRGDTPERIRARGARVDRRETIELTRTLGLDPAALSSLPSSAGPIGNPLDALPRPVTGSP